MIQGGDVGTRVVFIQGGFLLGGSGMSGDRVTWSGIIFFFLVTGSHHMAWFTTVKAEFVLETVVFFFRCKFTKGLRVLGNCGIDLCFICAIEFAGFGYKVG